MPTKHNAYPLTRVGALRVFIWSTAAVAAAKHLGKYPLFALILLVAMRRKTCGTATIRHAITI